MTLIITCEHAGNRIPEEYRYLFKNNLRILKSHRGWDKGALVLAKKLARELNAALFYSHISRLLIDLNRSLHHPKLFSEFSRNIDPANRQEIIEKYYLSYRLNIEKEIKHVLSNSRVIHLSIHSFTPVMNNKPRHVDIGLLYDPARSEEKILCNDFRSLLKRTFPAFSIRRNYPYKGNADGLTSHLRKIFKNRDYVGIEIEINQKHIITSGVVWSMINDTLGKIILELSD